MDGGGAGSRNRRSLPRMRSPGPTPGAHLSCGVTAFSGLDNHGSIKNGGSWLPRSRSLWLISLLPQREPRCEAVGSPLTPRSQVLTFLRCVPRTEANPNMFSACFSAPPCLRVKKHPPTRCHPDPDGTVGVPLCQGRLRTAVPRRIGKACSAHRRVRNLRGFF